MIIAGSSHRRTELQKALHNAPAIQIAGVLPAIAAARAHVELWHPDVVLIDLDRYPQRLEPPFAQLLEDFCEVAVVLLVAAPEPAWVARTLRSGVVSILRPDSPSEQITAAVRAAAEELIVLGRDAAEGLLESEKDLPEGLGDLERAHPLVEDLTRRELEVLRMVAAGLSNREIALRLGVSGHTIKFHISSILGKLGASSRTEAVTQGIKRGLILL